MKRFLKTLGLLVISLFIVASGVDAALDHLTHVPSQNSLTVYNEQGYVILTYNGDLRACKLPVKPGPIAAPIFFHRT